MRNKKSGLKIVLFVMALILGSMLYTISKQSVQISKLQDKRNAQDKEIETMELKIKNLEAEIESSGTLKFIEYIARDEYGMVKPKEVIFIDKDKEQNPFKNK